MLKFSLKLLLGLTIFGFLISRIGFLNIIDNLKDYNMFAILLINITTAGGYLLAASILVLLGRCINPKLKWLQGTNGVLATASLAIFIPGRAGDLTLPFYWKKFLKPGETMAVILVDKIITVSWLFFYGACGSLIVFGSMKGLISIFSAWLALLTGIYIFSLPKSRALIIHRLPTRLFTFLEGLVNALRTIKRCGIPHIFLLCLITGIRIFVNGLGFWISLYGAGAQPPLIFSVLVMSFAQFSIFVPISIMGLGTVEAICLYALSRINIDSGQIISALIVGRLTTMFWLGLFFASCAAGSNFKKDN